LFTEIFIVSTNLAQLQQLFGGDFLTAAAAMQAKCYKVRAFVFDWDGVFNNGTKDASGSSPFSEVDSMGLNMLRFNHFIHWGHNPVVAVITGEHNEAAITLAKREHFHAVYSKIRNKKDALQHLCTAHGIEPHEVAYFFDDVLDLPIAAICGIRILISRSGSPLFTSMVKEECLADYITNATGGNNGVREACELLMGLRGDYSDTIMQRVHNSETYQKYLAERNATTSSFYSLTGTTITEQSIK
jgi:3-deoxy-D-manno-octulosonate 8-phosphate phosphatase (KDO 8-P phosphatase)